MKKGINDLSEKKALENFFDYKTFQAMASNLFVIAGFTAYLIAAVLWLVAMKWLDVSFMYPLLSIGYVLVTFFAAMFLGEHVSVARWGGTILIIAGSALIVATPGN
jgi:drug/metabolite transporter (DMT)-like permease